MRTSSYKYFSSAVLLSFLTWTSVPGLADIVLHPGYLTGTFAIGDYNVHSVNISATGNGYSASKSVTGDTYTLTVEGGDWDYSVGANAFIRPVNANYPYTRMYFNNRVMQIPVGSTVTNDYDFGTATSAAAATIRFEVNITGDAYNSWTGYGYALQNVDPSVGERTNSQSYTHSSYSSTGSWNMPLVSNDNVRVYARVRVDSRWYYFWWSSHDLRYENIAPGATLVVPLNIEHSVVEPPPPPPEYEYGRVQGNIDLTLIDPMAFKRHRVYGYSSRYLYENPSSYLIDPVRTGTYTFRAYTWFDDYNVYLQWPYTDGDNLNDRVTVELDKTATKDFIAQTGILTGDMTFSGTLADADLNRYLYNYGAANFYDPVTSTSERQITYGGYAYQYKYMGNSDTSYRLFLQPGPWLPYRVNISASDSSQGHSQGFSLNIYDNSHRYDGNYYDFGEPTYIEVGATKIQNRDYCTGSVVVRFRDETGNTLSSPRFSASGSQRTETGKTLLSASGSAYSNIRDAIQPVVEMHAPPGDYNLSSITFQAADGTNLSFPGFPITFECGVRKGVPISGKPKIVVEQPPAYYVTNAQSVTVSGIAADDTGIASMTVNGVPVVPQPTGNPENEVSFNYELAVADGTNTITTTATDLDGNESFDERPIYVDRWLPTISIIAPTEGAIIADPQIPVPVEVQAVDRGFGFNLTVSVDGVVIHEAAGPVNELVVETLLFNQLVGPLAEGQYVIRADVSDAAGNSASDQVTITVRPANEAPVANDDTVTTPEDTPVLINVAANDTDVDGNLDPATATALSGPATGDLTNNADGTLSYQPAQNVFGDDSFTYEVCDTDGLCATATVSISIIPVNDLPVAVDDAYATDEDTPLTVAAPGVTGNDSDVDGDSLSVTGSTQPANGSLTVNTDGSFIYTPAADYHGSDSFQYTLVDGQGGTDTATVTLTVNAVNDPPVANNDTATTLEDMPVLIDVAANDADVDGNLDPATVTALSGPATGALTNNGDGTFSYQPAQNVFGDDSFTYKVCDTDGLCATATVSISIIPVNDLPVAVDDNYVTDEDTPLMVAATGVLGNDSDVDIGDSLSVTANSQPANGSLSVNADGSFSYTPNADYYGSDSFQYTIADSQGTTDTATVTLTVYAVNDPPVVSVDLVNQGVQYSDTITAVTVTATDIDSPLLTLSHTWTRDGGATQVGFPRDLAVSESCTLSGVSSSCSWILRGQTLVGAGTYALTFNVDDGTASQATATELVVIQEDASVVFKETNPLAVSVAEPGGYSGLFVLAVDVTETQPDKPEAGALPGDISLAEVSMTLEPVGPGPSVSSTCTPANSGSDYDAVQTVTCSFENVPVNTYTVVVSVGGDYYTGAAEDVLTVYDPSLGFTTGGGWFYWPGSEDTTNGYTGDKTNFGYTMKYGKNGNNVKGSLLLIRHLTDGTKYRVKSNALTGLAIGQDQDYGWASFSGKSTYLEPGMLEPEGNHQFTAYVEDRNEPGSGNDRFWITVRGKDGSIIPVISMAQPAPANAESIQGGNIVAPH